MTQYNPFSPAEAKEKVEPTHPPLGFNPHPFSNHHEVLHEVRLLRQEVADLRAQLFPTPGRILVGASVSQIYQRLKENSHA